MAIAIFPFTTVHLGSEMGTGHIYQASLFHNMWRNILLSSWWVPKGSVDFGLWWRWENRFTKPRPRLWSQNLEVKIALQNGAYLHLDIRIPIEKVLLLRMLLGVPFTPTDQVFGGLCMTRVYSIFGFQYGVLQQFWATKTDGQIMEDGLWWEPQITSYIVSSRENWTTGIPPNMRSKTISIPYVDWLRHSDSHNGLSSNLYSKRIFWIGAWKSDYQKFIPPTECRVYNVYNIYI